MMSAHSSYPDLSHGRFLWPDHVPNVYASRLCFVLFVLNGLVRVPLSDLDDTMSQHQSLGGLCAVCVSFCPQMS